MLIDTKLIKDLMLNKNISAYRLEELLGISRTTISNYRNGTSEVDNMSLTNAKIIQNYINMEENKMKKYTVLRDLLDDKGNPMDSEVVLKTDDLEKAEQSYEKLIEEIKFYDHEKTGASLLENLNEDESETLDYYVYG